MPSLSKSQVNKLGRRLRASSSIERDDLELLQRVRADYDDALAEVARTLRLHLDLQPTSRLKTVQTIVEKLKREPNMALSNMQDIAGLRVVMEITREKQDELARQIRAIYPGARISDRRANPSHGHRAVHVIVEAMGCPVEIQLRTALQNLWAQLVERLADTWGRQIRYGEPPLDPDLRVGSANLTRAELLSILMESADAIAEVEELQDVLATAEGLAEGLRKHVEEPEPAFAREVERAKERIEEVRRGLTQILARLEAVE